ncbi:PIN domain-containing protein [Intrasporangium sp.]|uniref:PIN domain-containing protein n=1 Tax=Intrasporangium sp. TaxID=1925024 RepID=UPI0032215EFB
MANADGWAVDTSVAVAALDGGHAAHGPCVAAVREHRPALAGHAAYEVFAVLTRMPGRLAVDATDAATLVERVFPQVAWLSVNAGRRLRGRLASLGIIGGAVYDALVGEAARTNRLRLLTRDLRACRTYDLLGVDHVFIGP